MMAGWIQAFAGGAAGSGGGGYSSSQQLSNKGGDLHYDGGNINVGSGSISDARGSGLGGAPNQMMILAAVGLLAVVVLLKK